LCEKIFNSRGSAKIHLNHVHNPQTIECLLCQRVMSSVPAFRKHVHRRHGIRGEKNVLETYGKHVDREPTQGRYYGPESPTLE
jgi:hypothetical protein